MIYILLFKLNKSDENQTEATKHNEHVTQEATAPVTATEEEVDEFIEQSIQINSNKQMRVEYLHPWTLKFKDHTQEVKYCQLREDMFRSNMLSVFIVWIFIVLCQVIIVPHCTVLVACLVTSTILLTCGCLLVMAEEFPSLPIFLQKSSAALIHHRDRRTLFICTVIFLMSAASSIGLIMCPMELNLSALADRNTSGKTDQIYPKTSKIQQLPNDLNHIQADKLMNNTFDKRNFRNFGDTYPSQNYTNGKNGGNDYCSHPEYLVFTWVLCLIALATGLKLYYLVKTFLAAIMVCCYAILISVVFPDVFENASTESAENSRYGMPLTARMNILLVVFLTMVTYHARLVEVTSRLDFIWKEQAEKELSNMKSNRILNDLLIKAR